MPAKSVQPLHYHPSWKRNRKIRQRHLAFLFLWCPVPFFIGKRVDFSVQWDALLSGRLVGEVRMEEPELHFVDTPGADNQTGAGVPWLQMLRDLHPFTINSAVIENGSIHFHLWIGLRAAAHTPLTWLNISD